MAGIPVRDMTAPQEVTASRGPGSTAQTPIGKAADVALERILSAKSAMVSASAGGRNAVGHPGETEHVVAVDELWKSVTENAQQKEVCLLVQELRDGVVFCAHNIGRKAVMVMLSVKGSNFETVSVRIIRNLLNPCDTSKTFDSVKY